MGKGGFEHTGDWKISGFDRFREWWSRKLSVLYSARWIAIGVYGVAAILIIVLLGPRIGRELFPSFTGNQFRLRVDAPAGTRAEDTQQRVERILSRIQETAGAQNVEISLGYV